MERAIYIEAIVLKELENTIGESIPKVSKIEYDTFGMVVRDNKVLILGLYKCGLKTLPDSFGNLKLLRELDLDDNELTTLPESFGNLKSLQHLELQHNKLTTLPESLCSIPNLKTIYITMKLLGKQAKLVINRCKKKGIEIKNW